MAHRSWAKHLVFLVFFSVAGITLRPVAAQAVDDTPAHVVKAFQDDLISVMRDAKRLGVKGRYQRLLPAVSRTFSLSVMVRIATGRHWQQATDAQRKRLVEAFRRMSVTTLAALIDGYSGEKFMIVGTQDGPKGTRLVQTRLITGSGEHHDIAYVAKRFDVGWRLIDVIVDNGISELRVRMSEYHRVLAQQGVEGLIRLLNGKADQLIANR